MLTRCNYGVSGRTLGVKHLPTKQEVANFEPVYSKQNNTRRLLVSAFLPPDLPGLLGAG